MTKHGTTSQVTGSYLEFQVAVLRALPRNIDPDIVLNWMRNGESLTRVLKDALTPNNKIIDNIFRITCEGLCKTSELVKRGKYGWSDNDITDKLFPLQEHAPVNRRIELIRFNDSLTSEEVLAEFNNRGLECPTYEDALYFGIEHPEEQRKYPIVFLHEPVRDQHDDRYVLILSEDASRRYLDLVNFFASNWFWNDVFAAVRK